MRKRQHRILALLLTLAMVFSMLPTAAFAAGGWWGTVEGGGNRKPNKSDGLGWTSTGQSGLRVTVVWFPTRNNASDYPDGSKPLDTANGRVVGTPIDLLIPDKNENYGDFLTSSTNWYQSNIFRHMIQPIAAKTGFPEIKGSYNDYNQFAFPINDTSISVNYPNSTKSDIEDMPKVVGYSEAGGTNQQLLSYLLNGTAPTNKFNAILKKYIAVANSSDRTSIGSDFSVSTFATGKYKEQLGQYYVFLENVYYVTNSEGKWALTLREILRNFDPGDSFAKGQLWWDQQTPITGMANGMHLASNKSDLQTVITKDLGLRNFSGTKNYVSQCDVLSDGLAVFNISPDAASGQAIATHINVFMNGKDNVEAQGIEYLKQDGSTKSLANITDAMVQAAVKNLSKLGNSTEDFVACPVHSGSHSVSKSQAVEVTVAGVKLWVCAEHRAVGYCGGDNKSIATAHYVTPEELNASGKCAKHDNGESLGKITFLTDGTGASLENVTNLFSGAIAADNLGNNIQFQADETAKILREAQLAAGENQNTVAVKTELIDEALAAALKDPKVRTELAKNISIWLSTRSLSSTDNLNYATVGTADVGLMAKTYEALKEWSKTTGNSLQSIGVIDIDESIFNNNNRVDGVYLNHATNYSGELADTYKYDQVGLLRSDIPYLVSDNNAKFKVPIVSSMLNLAVYNTENPDMPATLEKAAIKDFVTDLLNNLGEVMYDSYEAGDNSVVTITNDMVAEVAEKVDQLIWSYMGWGDLDAGAIGGATTLNKALAVKPNLSIQDHVLFGDVNSDDIRGAFSLNDSARIAPTMVLKMITSNDIAKYIDTHTEEEALAAINTITQPFQFQFTAIKDYVIFADSYRALHNHLVALIVYDGDMIYGDYNKSIDGYKVNQINSPAVNQVISDALRVINYASTDLDLAALQMGNGKFISMPIGHAFNNRTTADGDALSDNVVYKDNHSITDYTNELDHVTSNIVVADITQQPTLGSFGYIENATKEDVKDIIENVTLTQLNQALQGSVYAENGAGYNSEYKLQGDYGLSYTFWGEAIPVDLHIVGVGATPDTSLNTIIHNWGSAVPNFRNQVNIGDTINIDVNGKVMELGVQYFAIKPASEKFTSFFKGMVESKDGKVNAGTTYQSKVVDPDINKGTVVNTINPYNLLGAERVDVMLDNRYFFSVSDEDVDKTIPSAQSTGKDSEGRVELIVVVKSSEPIIQYNIVDQLEGKKTIVEKKFPVIDENGDIILEPSKPGADLIEWQTNTEDKDPKEWNEIPANPIDKGEDTKIDIDENNKPSVIYVHYVPKEAKATGTGTLSQKRITGSHRISELSSEGLIPVEWDWQYAGSHTHKSLTGDYEVPRLSAVIDKETGKRMNQAYMWIVNYNEDTIGSTGVVADNSTGKFKPSFDSTRAKWFTNLSAMGGVDDQDTEYFINLFRAKDKPTIASYANNGNPAASLGLQTGKIPANPRFEGDNYTGQLYAYLIADTTTVGLDRSNSKVWLRHTDGDSEANNPWGVRWAEYDIATSIASYKGTQNIGNKSSTPNATQNTFTAKTSNGNAVTAYNATGTSFHQDSAYKFYPYVEMVLENWSEGDTNKQIQRETVNVLGGHESEVGINDYVEVGYLAKPSATSTTGLSLESSQWSSHAQAVKNYGKDVVLPGGAIYTLKTPAGSETDVVVSMWLNMLDTDTIANATTNNPTAYSEANQLAGANTFLDTVKKTLDRYDLVQHLVDGKITNPATILGATGANHAIVGMKGGTPLLDGQTMTADAKYFLTRNTAAGSTKANEADLDVLKTDQSKTYYAIWADVTGKVYVGKGNSMQAAKSNVISTIDKTQDITHLANTDELKELDAKTKLLSNYLDGIDRNQGYDPDFGTTWYNEAWRPAYVCKYDTIYTIGLGSPTARTAAIDTHEEPARSDRAEMFADANSSMFAVNVKSSEYPAKAEGYVGTFKGADITIANVANMYTSKIFYIPNVSVTDLVNY